jgi:hypothetical protein
VSTSTVALLLATSGSGQDLDKIRAIVEGGNEQRRLRIGWQLDGARRKRPLQAGGERQC